MANADDTFDAIDEARRQFDDHGLDESRAMAATISLVHAHQVVSATVDAALKPLDLTFARFEVLTLLSFSRTGALPTTKIGERLLVHPTGVTKLVDKLEQRALVVREPNPDDRRGVLVRVTPEGRSAARQAADLLAEVRYGMDLSDRDLRDLFRLLGKLRPSG